MKESLSGLTARDRKLWRDHYLTISERRKQILEDQAGKGKLGIILDFSRTEPLIRVALNKTCSNSYRLAYVCFAQSTPLHEIGNDFPPENLLIFEPMEPNHQTRLIQIAKHLPAFFRDLGLETEVPINIYQSAASYKSGRCSAIISQDQGLVTIRVGQAIKKAAA